MSARLFEAEDWEKRVWDLATPHEGEGHSAMFCDGCVASTEEDLAFTAFEGPPYPPNRTHLRPGKKAVPGPEMTSASESPESAEADQIHRSCTGVKASFKVGLKCG
jgi:hypothetical protein